ncbi:MAG: hypothetical protein VKJ06_07695 [Vampirovibrionales bacterium]|nr:hypothetical protein [Vampirovibrionales bacterium]
MNIKNSTSELNIFQRLAQRQYQPVSYDQANNYKVTAYAELKGSIPPVDLGLANTFPDKDPMGKKRHGLELHVNTRKQAAIARVWSIFKREDKTVPVKVEVTGEATAGG